MDAGEDVGDILEVVDDYRGIKYLFLRPSSAFNMGNSQVSSSSSSTGNPGLDKGRHNEGLHSPENTDSVQHNMDGAFEMVLGAKNQNHTNSSGCVAQLDVIPWGVLLVLPSMLNMVYLGN